MPRPARAYLMTDADVARTAAEHGSSRPAAPIAAHEPQGDAGTDPDRALTDALSKAPAEGVSVPELVAATGRSRRWIYYRLHALAQDGRAEQTERGSWRTSGGDPT